MKIAMANDHAGTRLKNEIKAYLEEEGYEVVDFGTGNEESCDLSDFVYQLAWLWPRANVTGAFSLTGLATAAP